MPKIKINQAMGKIPFRITVVLVIAIAVVIIFQEGTFVSLAEAQSMISIQGADVGKPIQPFVVHGDLRAIPSRAPLPPGKPLMEVPLAEKLSGNEIRVEVEPADAPVQLEAGAIDAAEVTPLEFLNPVQNFPGMTSGQTGLVPPDTQGAVGPNDYIQVVNAAFQVFDKNGNARTGVININALWNPPSSGTNPFPGRCAVNNNGDPIVNYDHLADRWMISQFAVPNGAVNDPGSQCVAISQGPDPVTSGWFLYEFDETQWGGNLGGHDYPKIGVWPDGYYMSSQTGYSGGSINVFVMDRANMLNGNPATIQRFNAGSPAFVLLPIDLDGPPPPAGTPAYFARHIDSAFPGIGGVDRVEVFEFTVDWGNPANSTFIGPLALAAQPFDEQICDGFNLFNNCIPQPNTANLLETMSVWPMWRLQYRNFGTHASMVFNHSVDVDGNGNVGIRWYELRDPTPGSGAWTIHQEGTFAPQDTVFNTQWEHRWMGSIAMDKVGNIALGYSVSSTNLIANGDAVDGFPSIRYAGRMVSDPLDLLPHGEVTVAQGTAPVTNATRWGDYSDMSVDPVDDCTFWYTQELGGSTSWATRIVSFSFPSCNGTDLSIEKTAPHLIHAGEELFYEITVTNNGPVDATNVVGTDTLPAGVTFLTDTDSCLEAPTGTLTCQLGDLASGDSESFTIKVAVDADLVVSLPNGSSTITNTAVVSADQPEVNELNNEASVVTIVEDRADLQLSKVCKPDRPLLSGETAKCTLFVDNLGSSYARSVQLTDTYLSDGIFSFGAITPSQGSCNPPSDGVIECDLGDLAVQAPPDSGRATVEIEFTALRNMDINDLAHVVSSTFDPDFTNNMARGFIAVVEPDINVIMAENGDFGDLCEDDQKDLILTIRNQGSGDLIITDIVSDNPNNFNIVPALQYPLVIMPGEVLDIPIRFNPDTIEDCSDTIPRSADITIVSNDPDGPNITTVMGKVLCPNLVLDPPDLTGLFAFPPTVTDAGGELGCFSDKTVTITNDGFCPLKIDDITATPPFVVIDPTDFPITLQPHIDQLNVTVRFAPIAGGPVNVPDETTGTLQIASNDPDPTDTMADLCGEAIGEQAGLRVLGVEKLSGLPVDVLDVIKLKQGQNLIVKETNVSLKDTLICGNTVLYHLHREQLLPKRYKVIAKKKIGEHPYAGDIILRGRKRISLDPCQFEDLVLKMKQIDP